MKNFFPWDNRVLLGGIIVIAALAVYLPSATNDFVWDDYHLIVENSAIRSLSSVPALFTQDYGRGSGQTYNFYRPLQIAAYTLVYRAWGLIPAAYRLLNITAHALAAGMLFVLLLLLLRDPAAAFWPALVFAVHPVNSEAVYYISCLADCLCAFFVLVSCILYTKALDERPSAPRFLLVAGFIVSSLAALLSKELGTVIPVLLAGYHWIFRRRPRTDLSISLIAVFIVYGAARMASVEMFDEKGLSVPLLARRLPGFFAAVFEYTRLYFLPAGLHMDYGKHFFAWLDARVLAGIIVAALCARYLAGRPRATLAAVGAGVYAVGLVFHANLVVYLNQSYMMEHWFYLSSMGASCVLVYWMRMLRPKVLATGLCALMSVVFAGLTIRQGYFWKDEQRLYERSLQFTPDNFRVLNNLCTVYCDKGEYALAVRTCARALDIIPGSPVALSNLANALFRQGDVQEAVSILETLKQQGKASGRMMKNLGYMRGRMESGVAR